MTKWRCTLAWRNHYKPIPAGMPRVIAAVLCERPSPVPPEILEQWKDMGPGSGWSIGWEMIEQRPVRRWSPEAKAKVRKSNLRKRMEKRFPLFAADFIAAELAARPDYYEARQ